MDPIVTTLFSTVGWQLGGAKLSVREHLRLPTRRRV
jgi:hypothetical protein